MADSDIQQDDQSLDEEKVKTVLEEKNNDNEEIKAAEEKKEEEKSPQEDFKQRYFYLAAEMDNMKKRMAKEKESLLKYGNEKLLMDLVEVVDNFDRTFAALGSDEDEKVKNILVGIKMVHQQFSQVLSGHGLSEVESLGKEFDPNLHEAIGQKEVEKEEDEDKVLEEFQKGYTLSGRLIRPSKVMVGKLKD